MYFSIDSCGDAERHMTAEEARKAAHRYLDDERDACDPSWSESVTSILWGKVLGECQETENREATEDDQQFAHGHEIDRIVDYAIVDLESDDEPQPIKPGPPKASTTPTADELISPPVHLNGSGKERLIDNLCGVSQALNGAYEAMRAICPNGRDYYPLGAVAMARAEREHRSRLERLDQIKAETDAIAEAIADQG